MKEKWKYDNKATVTGIGDGNCRVIIADVYGRTSKEIDKQGHLIAASPELLAALKNLVYGLNVEMGRSIIQLCIDLAKNVIKKAEGK